MRFEHVGLVPDTVDYMEGWDLQKQVHQRVVEGGEDTVLLLEHTAVYTAGKRTEPHERPLDGTPVVDVDRGGKITWHGPGQLTGYPIVRLPDPVDVVAHVRRLEEVLIRTVAEYGIEATRVDGRSGAWVLGDPAAQDEFGRQDRKIGAVGIRVSRDVAMHGFALNVDCPLTWAEGIVPCGISDAGVTSIAAELRRRGEDAAGATVADALPRVEAHLRDVLGAVEVARPAATTAGHDAA
ncbi:lipoyl(octanoyl) transferase LipB [Kytococcus schroeteri]|uniref:lipoyl(octanoyl) transferase LipB n=1 Tax=Kytococcus schroeteri TaxID=138300 RepID=UPI0035E49636